MYLDGDDGVVMKSEEIVDFLNAIKAHCETSEQPLEGVYLTGNGYFRHHLTSAQGPLTTHCIFRTQDDVDVGLALVSLHKVRFDIT